MTPSSLVDYFSQELIDEIIDTFDSEPGSNAQWEARWAENLPTLRACALVCHAFLPRSQFHIFSILQLTAKFRGPMTFPTRVERRNARYHGLYDRLASKPANANGVHHLSLRITGTRTFEEDTNMARLVRFLYDSNQKIRMLSLDGPGAYPMSLRSPIEFHTKLIQPFIRTSFLTCLAIRRLNNIPVSLITGCLQLRELVLENVTAAKIGHYKSMDSSPRPKIHTLDFVKAQSMILALIDYKESPAPPVPLLDFSDVRTLRTQSLATSTVFHLAKICGSSIENLHFSTSIESREAENYEGSNKAPFDWGQFSRLRVLDIGVDVELSRTYAEGDSYDTAEPIQRLCQFLSKIPSPNKLTELAIRFRIRARDNGIPQDCLRLAWYILDAQIFRICCYKELVPLRFIVEVDYTGSEWENSMQEMCRHTFQVLLRERFPLINHSPRITLVIRHKVMLVPSQY